MQEILVTTDLSKEAAQAFPVARAQAEQIGKEMVHLTLLHVIEQPFAMYASEFGLGTINVEDILTELEKEATNSLEKLREEFPGIAVSTLVLRANNGIYRAIVEFAAKRQFQLIIMSTHGLTGLSHLLLGSVAEKVIRTAPCPVLIVPTKHARNEKESG